MECDRNICYSQDYNGGCATCSCRQPILSPCPFCGSKATINTIEPHTHIFLTFMPDYGGSTFIECTGCTCGVSGETLEEAVEIWNRRV